MIYLDFIRWWNKYTSACELALRAFMFANIYERKEGMNEDDEKQQQKSNNEREWMNEFGVIEMEWLATAFSFCSFIFQPNVIIFRFY